MESIARIVAAHKQGNSVVVSFCDGRTLLYTGTMLDCMAFLAEELNDPPHPREIGVHEL